MPQKVNLDALVPREDFEVSDPTGASSPLTTIQIRDLEPTAFFYLVVRKPDFQRETSEWGGDKIAGFIQSFLDGDLIPALILWQAGSQIFLIDGAHRLSALIAWAQDDYGDGKVSRSFYASVIPDEQLAVADKTRRLIKQRIGSYDDHQFAIQNPEKSKAPILERARRLASLALQLQWVKGDSTKAEASFFKINQEAAPIDKTELRLLQARRLPNALAARAIVRSGTGHKYWSRFATPIRDEIEAQAKTINDLLFTPALRTPIKTLDLPVAGRGYSSQTLPLVFELVNLSNDVKVDKDLKADEDGSVTLRHLKASRAIVNRMSGTHPSSLGLHPVVYFYSATGRYQPTAFLALVGLIKEFESRRLFPDFTRIRRAFEALLLDHKVLVNQTVVKFGSGLKGFGRLQGLFSHIIDELISGKSTGDIIAALPKHPHFSFLQPAEFEGPRTRRDFDADTKSAVFLKEALADPLRCRFCGGLIHFNSFSIDHIVRRADGGFGATDNGQLTHPYCNTTVKN